VNGVACTHLNNRPVAVTTSHDHTVHVWNLNNLTHMSTVDCPGYLTGAITEGRQGEVAVAVGWDLVILDHDSNTTSLK
jgi:hypothetical protein